MEGVVQQRPTALHAHVIESRGAFRRNACEKSVVLQGRVLVLVSRPRGAMGFATTGQYITVATDVLCSWQ